MPSKKKFLKIIGIPRNPKTHLPFEQRLCNYEWYLKVKKRASRTHKVFYVYSNETPF